MTAFSIAIIDSCPIIWYYDSCECIDIEAEAINNKWHSKISLSHTPNNVNHSTHFINTQTVNTHDGHYSIISTFNLLMHPIYEYAICIHNYRTHGTCTLNTKICDMHIHLLLTTSRNAVAVSRMAFTGLLRNNCFCLHHNMRFSRFMYSKGWWGIGGGRWEDRIQKIKWYGHINIDTIYVVIACFFH